MKLQERFHLSTKQFNPTFFNGRCVSTAALAFLVTLYIGCQRSLPPDVNALDDMEWSIGIIRPSEHRTKVFKINNRSKRPICIKEITTTCGCAVGEVITQTALPDSSVEFSLSYDAPRNPADDRRIALVTFENRPPVRVILTAKVRNELQISQDTVQWTRWLSEPGECPRSISIENFGGEEWTKVDVVGEFHEWLDVNVSESVSTDVKRFTAEFSLRHDATNSVVYRKCTAQIEAISGSRVIARTPVVLELEVAHPVAAYPKTSHVGTVGVGQCVKTVALIVSNQVSMPEPKWLNAGNKELRVAFSRESETRVDVQMEVTPADVGDILHEVVIGFDSDAIPEIRLMVRGEACDR